MWVDASVRAVINLLVDYSELGENLQSYLDQCNKIFNKYADTQRRAFPRTCPPFC